MQHYVQTAQNVCSNSIWPQGVATQTPFLTSNSKLNIWNFLKKLHHVTSYFECQQCVYLFLPYYNNCTEDTTVII